MAGWFDRIVDGDTRMSHNVAVLDFRAPWQDLGTALPGRATPQLRALGAPAGAARSRFELRFAPPLESGVLAVGLGRANLPLLGGTLVPPPQLLIWFAADLYGTWRTSLQLPSGILAPGTELTAPAWLLDPSAPRGVTASNAVSGLSP